MNLRDEALTIAMLSKDALAVKHALVLSEEFLEPLAAICEAYLRLTELKDVDHGGGAITVRSS